MKYKVGDKVRVNKHIIFYFKNGCVSTFESKLLRYNGTIVTIHTIDGGIYKIEEDEGFYDWYEYMLEPVEEMSAEEAIKLSADLCSNTICDQCPVLKLRRKYGNDGCHNTKREHTEEYLEILKQWKADHEKKSIETEFIWYLLVVEEKTHIVKYEKPLKIERERTTDEQKEELLREWCSEHDGKYYVTAGRRCVVKE